MGDLIPDFDTEPENQPNTSNEAYDANLPSTLNEANHVNNQQSDTESDIPDFDTELEDQPKLSNKAYDANIDTNLTSTSNELNLAIVDVKTISSASKEEVLIVPS